MVICKRLKIHWCKNAQNAEESLGDLVKDIKEKEEQ